MAQLLLIRHGQASYGEADYDRLSPRGHEQARALGRHLAGEKLDALFVGPLRRQIETAAVASEYAIEHAGGALPKPTPVVELAEYPAFEIVKQFPGEPFHDVMNKWARGELVIPGVEHVREFAARVRAGLDRIVGEVGSGGRIGVVTSAGPIGVALGLVFGASEHHMIRASAMVRNASVSELKLRTHDFAWHPERVALVAFNSVAHLPPELHTEY
jgi:broad specificity phosphatase PhoE